MITALAIALTLAAPGDTLIRNGGGKLFPGVDGGFPSPLLVIPFNKTGPLITEDANTVTHVYFDGSQLVDTQANLGWHLDIGVNAPTQNVTSPFYPDGFASAMKRGAGPFSDLDNYYHGTSSVLAAGSDFMACVVYRGGATGSTMINDTRDLASGWRIVLGGTIAGLTSQVAGCSALATVSASAINVLCVGRSGTTGYAQVNGGTVVTDATCAALDTCGGGVCDQRIGPKSGDGTWPGVLYEFYWTSTAWNATTAAQIQARVLGQYATNVADTTTTPLTVTRSSTATYEQPAGTLWTAPAGALRVNSNGALIEANATNVVVQSGSFCTTGNAVQTPWTLDTGGSCVNNADGVAPDGVGAWDRVQAKYVFQAVAHASTTTRTVSAWIKAPSGTVSNADITFASEPGYNVSSCTCSTSDGRACATIGGPGLGGSCQGSVTATTTPTRLSVTAVHTSAATGAWLYFNQNNNAQVDYWGMQLVTGTQATSYIPTTTTSAVRQADNHSVPVALSGKSPLCVRGDVSSVPALATVDQTIVAFRTAGNVDKAYAYFTSGNYIHVNSDASAFVGSYVPTTYSLIDRQVCFWGSTPVVPVTQGYWENGVRVSPDNGTYRPMDTSDIGLMYIGNQGGTGTKALRGYLRELNVYASEKGK